MAMKKISEFVSASPTSEDKILFEHNGSGKNCSIGDAVNTCSLSYEEIMASTDLTGKVASAITIKNMGINKIFIIFKSITDDSNLITIEAGPDTYQGQPKFVSAILVPPFNNADIGGYVWYQNGDEQRIFLRHSKPSRSFGNPAVLVMVIV